MKFQKQARLLKTLRLKKGVTQAEVATVMGLDSSQSVSNIERGIAGVPPEHMKAMGKYLNCDWKRMLAASLADHRALLLSKI